MSLRPGAILPIQIRVFPASVVLVISWVVGMWQQFVSSGGRYRPEDSDYRRAYLINAMLVVYIATLVVFIPVNWFLADLHFLASVQCIILLSIVATLIAFRRFGGVDWAGTVVVLLTALALSVFFFDVRHQFFSFVWLYLFPPVAFFLKGHRQGLVYSSVFLGGVLVFVSGGVDVWEPAAFNWQSGINIGFAGALVILLVIFFEASRVEWVNIIEEKNRQLQSLASTDPLTGLLNRRAFFDRAAQLCGEHDPYAVIMLDIDNFKRINDLHGHAVGDQVLKHCAEAIRASLSEGVIAARFGGEEFLLMTRESGVHQIEAWADSLMDRLEARDEHSSALPEYTASLGVAYSSDEDEELDSVIRRADQALYRAKAQGRNRVEFSSSAHGSGAVGSSETARP